MRPNMILGLICKLRIPNSKNYPRNIAESFLAKISAVLANSAIWEQK
jgi:hypothetical protein